MRLDENRRDEIIKQSDKKASEDHKINSEEHKEASRDLQFTEIMNTNAEVAELYQDTLYKQRAEKELDFTTLSNIQDRFD